ncbi:McrB family protein [Sporichthya brevicatena]|uniref:McrB family protein n=1 Tax=Sporichthya brevicatena TaxID=171442 RepID=UPI0031D51826
MTRRRLGEIQRAIFAALLDHPDGLDAKEACARAEALCPPTAFENADYPSSPGARRYPKMQRFATISSVKAGWLVKHKGVWRLTDSGRGAYATYTDPDAFEAASRVGYKKWQQNHVPATYDAAEEAADAEAVRLEAADRTRQRRAWLIRGANVDGVSVLPQWFAEGFCSIGWRDVPEIPPGTTRAGIAALVKESTPDDSPVSRGLATGVLDRFHNVMRPGDLVATLARPNVYVGEITGDPLYTGDPLTPRRRPVRWRNAANPFLVSDLPPDAADSLRGQMTLSDLTDHFAEFARLGGVEVDATSELLRIDAVVPTPDEELAEQLLLPLDWLTETVELLNEKRQIVLYGPPGTGKTYLAQQLCKALVEAAGGEYDLVQFHPSYAYEDFFEGLRPRLDPDGSGGVAFELVPGPLRRMAARAAANPTVPFVLIIDEINRANLAKVFGELYFLLEYRNTSVSLQYSDESFALPKNLYLIGTMNTADRSIALVDAAMRRRFYFQGLFPTEAPVDGVLTKWLTRHRLPPEPAALLNALNDAIGDPDFAVGPSYLMTPRVGLPGGLERIWRTGILPLLAEHYFGEGRDIDAEFGLDALRERMGGAHRTDPSA